MRLIAALQRLPGIGEKTAQRLAFFLVRAPDSVTMELGQAVGDVKKSLRLCTVCKNITTYETCAICTDDRRERMTICVVEQPLDVAAIERSGTYRGTYHVLHGVLNPLDGIGPDALTISALIKRVMSHPPTELILAMNPSIEGEATALFIAEQVKPLGISVTRLARGLPTGSELTYADEVTVTSALSGRRAM